MAAGVSINLQNHFDQVTVDSGGHLSVVKCRRQMTSATVPSRRDGLRRQPLVHRWVSGVRPSEPSGPPRSPSDCSRLRTRGLFGPANRTRSHHAGAPAVFNTEGPDGRRQRKRSGPRGRRFSTLRRSVTGSECRSQEERPNLQSLQYRPCGIDHPTCTRRRQRVPRFEESAAVRQHDRAWLVYSWPVKAIRGRLRPRPSAHCQIASTAALDKTTDYRSLCRRFTHQQGLV